MNIIQIKFIYSIIKEFIFIMNFRYFIFIYMLFFNINEYNILIIVKFNK